jgi:sensor histidine kinase YesM
MKKSKVYNLILALICFSQLVSARTIADSLKQLAYSQKDSVQVDTYIQLARYYFQAEHIPDSMIKYAKLAVDVAIKNRLSGRILKSQKALGLAYTEAGNVKLSQAAYDEAMKIAVQTKNTEEIITIYNKLGYLYGKTNDLVKSSFYYLNTAKEYEKLKDYKNLAFTYKNVVVIFTLLDQQDKILKYTNQALALIPKINPSEDAEFIVDVYSTATQHYFYVGEKQKNQHLINEALAFADSCLKFADKYKIKNGLADAYYIKAHNYREKKDYENAILFSEKALEGQELMRDRRSFNIYALLAQSCMEMGNYKKAIQFLDSCKTRINDETNLDEKMLVADLEYHLYKETNDYAKSLNALETLIVERQKIQEGERNKMINELDVKYQTELKEATIQKLHQQKEIDKLQIRSLIWIVTAIVLLLMVIVFFYRQSIIKSKLNSIEIEQRLNRARMNPHFFFNALASLQNLSLSDTRKDLVPGFISKFSKIMRQSLESTFNELDTIENEISFLTDYLELQKLRSENRFDYEFEIDDAIEINELLIPGMILQPFIENSIEHGFKNITHVGHIKIAFSKNDKNLRIVILDNGKGIKDNETHKDYPSRATQIIKDRLYLLNKTYKTNATFVLNNLENDNGIKVLVDLPLIYKT